VDRPLTDSLGASRLALLLNVTCDLNLLFGAYINWDVTVIERQGHSRLEF
jgi:hypothetical protein